MVINKREFPLLGATVSLSLSFLSLMLPAQVNAERQNQVVEYSTPTYGYSDNNTTEKKREMTQEEAEMKRLYTPVDEFQLPERLSEYEEPENTDKENGERLNAGIPSVIQTIYKRTANKESQTKVIGSNIENTSTLDEVIDLDIYVDRESIEEREANKKIAMRYLNKEVTKEEIETQLEAIVFPVKTDLKPTRMPSGRMELNPSAKRAVTTPMVFMGMDEYSLSWFKMNLEEIKKYSPPIFVTQVDSLVDLQQLKRFAPEMKLIPVRGDEALKLYGVDFYPVMITTEGIFQ